MLSQIYFCILGFCVILNYQPSLCIIYISVLERDGIFVDVPAKLNESGAQQMLIPLKCTVWAVADPSAQKKSLNFEDFSEQVDLSVATKSLTEYFFFPSNKEKITFCRPM